MALHPRWPDDPPTSKKVHRVGDVLAGAFLMFLLFASLAFMLWHSARADDNLDKVPTTFPEERYEPDHPGSP